MKFCRCGLWIKNIGYLPSFIALACLHEDRNWFEFCPWCGKTLQDTDNPEEPVLEEAEP